jgi:hypothetical protein
MRQTRRQTHVGNMFAELGLPPAAGNHRRVLAVLAYLRREAMTQAHCPRPGRPR